MNASRSATIAPMSNADTNLFNCGFILTSHSICIIALSGVSAIAAFLQEGITTEHISEQGPPIAVEGVNVCNFAENENCFLSVAHSIKFIVRKRRFNLNYNMALSAGGGNTGTGEERWIGR